ncbi:GAF domain-containing sensor histidine kinase [Pedobacter sp. Du54]|uniref:GAF domain-containing sensor histidine kinase n=1 Tax=Pedobacter anseongensis TaxID=3133439 RepID=UPI0030A2BC31
MNTNLNIEADVAAIGSIDVVSALLEVVCRTTGMGFAAIARVTEERWVACAVRDEIQFGLLPGGELKVETTLCHEIRQHKMPIVINNVAKDEVYANHHTPKLYGLQSYISIPITTKSGVFFGTLCAIDPNPADINKAEIINMFVLFADLIAFHLHAINELELKEAQLVEAKKTAELRDKFIAILGHDLRNPVGAILNVSELLLRMPVEDRVKRMATIVQTSTQRMRSLIENILDFARGHLGEGIKLNLSNDEQLEATLLHIVEELRLVSPDYIIETKFTLEQNFNCDGKRMAQLLSNLLGNALTHGKSGAPVQVVVSAIGDEFLLSVTNEGNRIDERVMERLFQPFYKGDIEPTQRGLGLGLYIAAEIAKAHKGKLEVHSTDEFTCFTFKMVI